MSRTMDKLEVVGYGFPNTAITGHSQPMMMLRHDIPADDQYGGSLWHPLVTLANAEAMIKQARREAFDAAASIDFYNIIRQMQIMTRENASELHGRIESAVRALGDEE